ncbi:MULTISPECIES: exodeoxyribonuclease VII small subunit [Corynebacterium]|uniref:Exodeoxyribonuclease 7 small subunit n=2 Tax=Corynebacterium aurimucosum TaxID=169292 RepID=EX7S_CORA7|nr:MULTISPECIES: exodeoxyribonuclease VII small subunit [Corynebacterium]C3PFD4.1 RecName: Full=Exodeoxyribonuclease 7 small subunit; AltName: Full=Exodeoxyribonuclease VII small subunit; Short=Exonuclease VII small subunit [Corynebacterium aurimucosum ATCC 700975]ACP32538.1 exodeoxyribonuclease small subunit [Corynebacterium aurimucosum ATCC 700975]MBU5653732.1 exodeoxyribonuclease VII small subunit [Corynebacterium aurimucosum]MDK6812716.1 exodeoxyribonuclease VII small subunit [Corynebacteri
MTDTIGAGQPGQDAFPPVEELSYEQARDELIETVKILELGQMGLDESLKYWERGEALAKACEAHLDGASKRVEEALRKNAEGTDSAAHNEEAGED